MTQLIFKGVLKAGKLPAKALDKLIKAVNGPLLCLMALLLQHVLERLCDLPTSRVDFNERRRKGEISTVLYR